MSDQSNVSPIKVNLTEEGENFSPETVMEHMMEHFGGKELINALSELSEEEMESLKSLVEEASEMINEMDEHDFVFNPDGTISIKQSRWSRARASVSRTQNRAAAGFRNSARVAGAAARTTNRAARKQARKVQSKFQSWYNKFLTWLDKHPNLKLFLTYCAMVVGFTFLFTVLYMMVVLWLIFFLVLLGV